MFGLASMHGLGNAAIALLVGAMFSVWAWRMRRLMRPWRCIHVAALSVVAVTVIGLHWTTNAETGEIERRFALLTAFAETYAQEFEVEGHANVATDVAPDDPQYLKLVSTQIAWLAKNPLISDVYTFRKRADGSIALVVDAETDYGRDGAFLSERERRTTPGEHYESVDAGLLSAFTGTTSITPEAVTDRWGTWYSVFVPMHDARGNVEGVLGVDTSATEIESSVTTARMIRIGTLVAIVAGLLAAFGAIELLRANLEARRSYEAKLDVARVRAEAASATKSRFLTNMSHELRTPMNGIVGMATLLLDTPMLGEHRSYVETIRSSGEQLLTLLQDMIDLAAIEGGEFDPAVGPFDPIASVKTVLALFHADCIDRGLDLRLDVGEGVPAVLLGDATRVRQMLRHLVSNALKFTSRGSVAVQLGVIGKTVQSTVLRIAVRDTGRGMSESQIEGLTDRFTQGDESLTRERSGVGVGLALTRRLCVALSGSMRIASEPGKGTAVTLELPFQNAPATLLPTPPSAPHRTARIRVLVVDDNPVNRKIASKMLERIGCLADEARGGMECLRLVDTNDYDLVLMDCQMPEVDGFETTRRLRATPRGKNLRIVALTAHSLDEHRRMSLECGMNDHITKPVRLEDLVRMIEAIVHARPTSCPLETPSPVFSGTPASTS